MPKLRFAHIRLENHPDEESPFYPRGGETFCYEFLPNGKIKVAHSYCSIKDNYSRKIGRTITMGRMLAGQFKVYDYDREVDGPVVDFLLDAAK